MDRLAHIAEEHWKRHLPVAYATLDDPGDFFQRLADEVWTQIDALADQLAGPDPLEEPFMDKASRLSTARATAESQVVREMLLVTPEADRTASNHSVDDESSAALAEFQQARNDPR